MSPEFTKTVINDCTMHCCEQCKREKSSDAKTISVALIIGLGITIIHVISICF